MGGGSCRSMRSTSSRLIDCLFSEFSAACEAAEVIEETIVSDGLKEVLLTAGLDATAPRRGYRGRGA